MVFQTGIKYFVHLNQMWFYDMFSYIKSLKIITILLINVIKSVQFMCFVQSKKENTSVIIYKPASIHD